MLLLQEGERCRVPLTDLSHRPSSAAHTCAREPQKPQTVSHSGQHTPCTPSLLPGKSPGSPRGTPSPPSKRLGTLNVRVSLLQPLGGSPGRAGQQVPAADCLCLAALHREQQKCRASCRGQASALSDTRGHVHPRLSGMMPRGSRRSGAWTPTHRRHPPGRGWGRAGSCPCRPAPRRRRRRSRRRRPCHRGRGRPGWRWRCRGSCPGCSGGRPHRCPRCCHTGPPRGRCPRRSGGRAWESSTEPLSRERAPDRVTPGVRAGPAPPRRAAALWTGRPRGRTSASAPSSAAPAPTGGRMSCSQATSPSCPPKASRTESGTRRDGEGGARRPPDPTAEPLPVRPGAPEMQGSCVEFSSVTVSS